MRDLDYQFVSWLNQFAHRSQHFDELVFLISSNYVLKTALFIALLTWQCFEEDEGTTERRARLMFGLIASWTAVLFTRVISMTAPFQERPLRNPDLHLVLPYPVRPDAISGWSSFPSDNATLWFGMVACIFLVSRRAGFIALIHALIVVAFARMYLGYHYPTDILAGALIGVGTVSLFHVHVLRAAVTRVPIHWLQSQPQSFYAAFIFLLCLTATTFEPLYPLAHAAVAVVKKLPLFF